MVGVNDVSDLPVEPNFGRPERDTLPSPGAGSASSASRRSLHTHYLEHIVFNTIACSSTSENGW